MFSRILLVISFMLVPVSIIQAQSPEADQFIKFVSEADADSHSDCNQRGGLRIFVVNQHPSNIIDIHIDRYFSDIRQGGRSMLALGNGHKLALGCNIVMDSPQHWALVKAEFISPEQAQQRYGVVY
ncbi:hypothetical protein [Methylophaga sp.]|jgi:hypothetical protein|uniref:hypothetical protein n=1 Tax=Methylophaga sp. TaxID=2024840 RepID=UPI0013FF6897|nr:hypothetical protein [Methylophaga sp.]MTI62572.1 hypothetical protein [Methylophaga sp.]